MNKCKNCLDKNLIRKIPKSKENCLKCFEISKKWILESKNSIENNSLNSAIITLYLSIFHSARAFLYFEGYREKSHYCVSQFLREFYVSEGLLEEKWVDYLDFYRDLRHEEQYGLESSYNLDDLKEILEIVNNFYNEMQKLYYKILKE